MEDISKLCAFSNGAKGGHPSACVLVTEFGSDAEMHATAKRIGYDEVVFAYPQSGSNFKRWRVRFFSLEGEIPCGGASLVVFGAIMANQYGVGAYKLQSNNAELIADVVDADGRWETTITSAHTWSRQMPSTTAADFLREFGLTKADLIDGYEPMVAYAGAAYLFLLLKMQQKLKDVTWKDAPVKALIKQADITSVAIMCVDETNVQTMRVVYGAGGVKEEGATGAAAAAFGGLMRDLRKAKYNANGNASYEVQQGDAVQSPSTMKIEFVETRSRPVMVWGTVRAIVDGQRDPRQDNIQPPEQPAAAENQQAQNDQNQNQDNQQAAPRGNAGGPVAAGDLPPPRAAD